MKRGLFVTFEGIEGSGKTTQHGLLCRELERRGFSVVAVREPGGTAVGDRIREIVLDPRLAEMTPEAEALLYAASRSQLVRELIVPSLDAGKIVACDRYLDSSIAYQVYGRGLDVEFVLNANKVAREVVPRLTFLVEIDVEVGLARATKRSADRIERLNVDFHRRVAEGYRKIAASEPSRVRIVDGALPVEELHAIIVGAVESEIKAAGLDS